MTLPTKADCALCIEMVRQEEARANASRTMPAFDDKVLVWRGTIEPSPVHYDGGDYVPLCEMFPALARKAVRRSEGES